jgi:hypothetical protein
MVISEALRIDQVSAEIDQTAFKTFWLRNAAER